MAEVKAKTTKKVAVKKTVVKKPAVKKTVAKKVVAKKVETKKVEKNVSEIALNPAVWNVAYNSDLVAQVLYIQQSNARLGTAKAKTRAEVSGGGRKPWKQKGTGRARHGSIRSPLWRKGGVTFPPSDRTWDKKINKKMVKKAICIMLSERLKNETLEFVNISKKELKEMRSTIEGQMGKGNGLIITDSPEVKMAVSNVKKINYSTANNFSVMNLVRAKKILVDNNAVKMIEDRLTNGK